jgi:hypothetical protein
MNFFFPEKDATMPLVLCIIPQSDMHTLIIEYTVQSLRDLYDTIIYLNNAENNQYSKSGITVLIS